MSWARPPHLTGSGLRDSRSQRPFPREGAGDPAKPAPAVRSSRVLVLGSESTKQTQIPLFSFFELSQTRSELCWVPGALLKTGPGAVGCGEGLSPGSCLARWSHPGTDP